MYSSRTSPICLFRSSYCQFLSSRKNPLSKSLVFLSLNVSFLLFFRSSLRSAFALPLADVAPKLQPIVLSPTKAAKDSPIHKR